ncbi:MAG: sarcosine oxidase subunit gamma [Pseudomonadota bacterium]
MIDLIAKSPLHGAEPLEIGPARFAEMEAGTLTSLLPYRGQSEKLSVALQKCHGLALPKANRATGKSGARALWFGRGQTLLIGPTPDPKLAEFAAVVDQSDSWAIAELQGNAAEAVLARLCPLDFRVSSFKRGHTARTDLKHMMASVTRTGPQSFQIMVFRSMAQTLLHDVTTAMESVAARK